MPKPLTQIFGVDKIANLLLKYNYQAKQGDILAGTIIGIEKTQIIINLGLESVAFLPKNEIYSFQTETRNLQTEKNNTLEFLIIYYISEEKKIIISLRRLSNIKIWERFKQIDFKNMILYAFFEKHISSARIVNFDGLKIYVPNFHLPKYYRRVATKTKPLKIKVLEVKNKNHIIIGSVKFANLKKQSPVLDIDLIQIGYVLKVKPFGIFINILGIKCLLHISEILVKKEELITNLYQKGDELKVKVIYINNQQGKIALSAKI